MRSSLVAIALFVVQIYLTFRGAHHFSKWWSPLLLFLVSAGIAVLYFREHLRQAVRPLARSAGLHPVLWSLGGALSMVLAYEELRKVLVAYANPAQFSDVMPQLEALYQRFSEGVFPYAPLVLSTHSPYPVYMPLHWLPLGLGETLGIDVRWAGYGLLVLAAGVYGYWIGRQKAPVTARIVALVLPSVGLWGFILWGQMELAVSYELVIAAFYLVLASGLLGRNVWLITLGLILCLLSRYTLVFWLPLMAWLLWREYAPKINFAVWGSVALSVLLVYIVPFYLKDPTILSEGIKYHNGCAVGEWTGYGEPPVSWSMEKGFYFGLYMKNLFSGDMAQRVTLARVVQAAVMLALLGFGLWAERRWKTRLDRYALGLVMLYAMVGCFYFFSPMTFQYYYLVLFMLSAVVVGKILVQEAESK